MKRAGKKEELYYATDPRYLDNDYGPLNGSESGLFALEWAIY
jgi:hypothetical protein